MTNLPTRAAAFALLAELDAPERLVQHAEWVGQAAELLLVALGKNEVQIDEALELARICRVHGNWRTEATSLEELLVALADKL